MIIRRVGTAQTQAGGGDRLGRAHRLAGKARRAAAQADRVAAQDSAEGAGGDGRGRGAVVNFVVRRYAARNRRRRDIRRRAGGGVDGVIGRIDAADGDAAHAHGLGRAHILVGEARAAVAPAQDVARYPIIGQRHRRAGRAIVHFVRGCSGHRQGTRGDVCRRRRLRHRVVGCVRAAHGQPAHRHGLGCAGGFAGEGARRAAAVQRHCVSADDA